MRLLFCIISLVIIGLSGCTSADKYSGEYGSDDTTLKVEKNKNSKNEYNFKFSNMRIGDYDFFVELKQDGTANYIIKDQNNIKENNNCKLDIKFFNDSVSIKQEPCGIYTFDGTYKKESKQPQAPNTQTPASKTETPAQKNSAPEQKIIFQTNSVEYKTKGVESSEGYCKEECNKISESITDNMAQGWKVVSSTPRKQAINQLCTCDGVEYIISK